MIELDRIGKAYQMGDLVVPVLRDVSLRIEPGEFVAIMGQSGSGKSTLLHILGLLDRPDAGTYTLDGQNVTSSSDDALAEFRSETMGFVFQQFHLLRRTTALDNVSLPLFYGKKVPARVNPRDLLERVGLGHRLNHLPNQLSGGQQQRVAIARSLVRHPKILFADEPTGNLDSSSGREILSLFQKLNEERITIIMVTHERTIAEAAHRIIHIEDGRIRSDERLVPATAASSLSESRNVSLSPFQALSRLAGHFHQAYRALLLNKMRTCLSALGIVIGVAAVIDMLALGEGAQKSVAHQLSGLGSNRLVIRPESQNVGGVRQQIGNVSRLSPSQVEDLQALPLVQAAAPVVEERVQVVWQAQNANTQAVGTTPAYAGIYSAEPAYGRFFTDEENLKRSRVALLGRTVVKSLFGKRNPVGETIKINRIPFQVIGVLKPRGAAGPQDEDDVVLIPVQTAMHRLMGDLYFDSIAVTAQSADAIDQTESEVRALFPKWPKVPGVVGVSYRIDNLASVQEAFESVVRTMSLLLAAIAAISLFVGGIGIMNIMLVSVSERTREIGLRKAIGATNRDVLMQFLVEAVALCLLGGFAGILLGSLIIITISSASKWPLEVAPQSAFLACVFSAFVGLIFGLLPARHASILNPIDALRHE